jgi:microcin C transport system substrate-binding protein
MALSKAHPVSGCAFLKLAIVFLVLACGLDTVLAQGEQVTTHTSHGLALFGELKYSPDFTHFDYANPQAPKGGTYTYGFASSFDNLNPFIVAGSAPLQNLEILLFDPLMVRSGDEPTSVYGLIAQSVTWADDYSWVEFTLREGSKWQDDEPITPEDVMFTVKLMKEQAPPQFRSNFNSIEAVSKVEDRGVRFDLAGGSDKATIHAIAQLRVLPQHWWRERDFSKPTIEPPLGSGPYRISKVDPGRSITYERVKDYWAADLPVNKGLWNYDQIRHDYYRDISIEHEALLAGKVDLRWETLPSQWATGYDVEAVHDGRLIKEMLPFASTTLYSGYFFNLRKPEFRDPAVREAIAYAFDFEWTNKTVLHGQYQRLLSYFENSELAAKGLPSAGEIELLEPWRDQLPAALFTEPSEPPKTDGSRQSLKENLRTASKLLQAAGWTLVDGQLTSPDGKPMEFEIIGFDPFFERVTGPFVDNLQLLGIKARQRTVDTAQWFNRIQNFEFDITTAFYFPQQLSPGMEQWQFWGSEVANQPGSSNYAGIQSTVVDALIEDVVTAQDRQSKITATRALDRVLLWNWYTIPMYYSPGIPIVYWNKFGQPQQNPRWVQIIWHMSNWWIDPARVAALEAAGK